MTDSEHLKTVVRECRAPRCCAFNNVTLHHVFILQWLFLTFEKSLFYVSRVRNIAPLFSPHSNKSADVKMLSIIVRKYNVGEQHNSSSSLFSSSYITLWLKWFFHLCHEKEKWIVCRGKRRSPRLHVKIKFLFNGRFSAKDATVLYHVKMLWTRFIEDVSVVYC